MNIKSIAIILTLALFTLFSSAQDILGIWKTIDDETGKVKSFVKIYKKNDGKVYGKIVKLFREEGEDQNPSCTKCTDYRKGKKIIGMQIITGLVKDGSEWEDGEILDPKNGKTYDCKIWIENGKLQVRGYVGWFYRTQTWVKVKS